MVDFDKAKEFAGEHSEQVDEGVEKAGDMADEKTGGQHAEQVDKGQEALRDQAGGGAQESAAADE